MTKINITYDCLVLQKFAINAIIKKCIETTLKAERVIAPLRDQYFSNERSRYTCD